MSFSYAVIRHTADGWRVCVNDYAKDHEATAKSLPEIIKQAQRLIEQCQAGVLLDVATTHRLPLL